MFGDSRRDSEAAVSIKRLSELIPETENRLAAVGRFANACMDDEHSDLSALEAFEAECSAQQLYDCMALAGGYFTQLGIGPDAEALLCEVEKLQDEVHNYGVELVKLADAAKGDAASEADLFRASDKLHDKAIILYLSQLGVWAAYETLKEMFEQMRDASAVTGEKANGDCSGLITLEEMQCLTDGIFGLQTVRNKVSEDKDCPAAVVPASGRRAARYAFTELRRWFVAKWPEVDRAIPVSHEEAIKKVS